TRLEGLGFFASCMRRQAFLCLLRQFPQAHRVVGAAGHEETAVAGDGHGQDWAGVPLDLLEFPARFEIPQTHATARIDLVDDLLGPGSVGADRPLTVRRETNRFDKVAGTVELFDLFAGLDVPEPHRAVETAGEKLLAARRN